MSAPFLFGSRLSLPAAGGFNHGCAVTPCRTSRRPLPGGWAAVTDTGLYRGLRSRPRRAADGHLHRRHEAADRRAEARVPRDRLPRRIAEPLAQEVRTVGSSGVL